MMPTVFSRRQSIAQLLKTVVAASMGTLLSGAAKAQVDKLTITGLSEARLRTF